ncbi:MAG: hypothetical protein QOE70_3662 [Chthoniobacter sp.]|jgi:hypothetical protein|nr:hypothetical protein [Chthoniobacter sp.]
MNLPRVTVVTPSFNQAAFLETTILSVLGQCYPNLEYFVMDGGSTDGSREILERYKDQFAFWQSQPDGGQSAALNAAFARATGEIFCWINSDDFLLPGTLHQVARLFAGRVDQPHLAYGSCLFFHDRGKRAKVVRARPHDPRLLRLSAYLIQPSVFWTRALWDKAGPLDQALSFAFDWDWFIRASSLGEFTACDQLWSAYRFHEGHKSSSGSAQRRSEILSVARRHADPQQVAAYEFVDRHWDRMEKRRALGEAWRRRGIPGAERWARYAVPLRDAVPAGVSPEDLRLCENMLRGS